MRKSFSVLFLMLFTAFGCKTFAQDKKAGEPQFKLVEFQMAILKHAPSTPPSSNEETLAVQRQHVEYMRSLVKSGKAVITGSITDDSDLAAVYILRTKSAEEARELVEADPAVAAKHLVAESHPWWSEDVWRKTNTPEKLFTSYLAFLVRGEKWTPESTPQAEEIQKAHLANIKRLADMKKLVVAGPFGDNGTLRGIFVFRVGSLEEARNLTLTDPAVQAGRLALDIHPWLVSEEILP